MLYRALPLAALIATAFAAPGSPIDCPLTICVDGVNDCGVGFGGCYDACQPSLSPTPPDCPVTTLTPVYSAAAPLTTDDCSTRSVCADYVNECGIWYGGCFADCTPWPTFTPPPCPSTTSLVDIPVISTDFSDIFSDLPETLTDFPEISISLPDISTDLPGTLTDFPEISSDLPEPITTDFPDISTDLPGPLTTDDCSTRTICADYINDCGIWYGGCFADCTPWPTFTPPPCPSTTSLVGYPVISTDFPKTTSTLEPTLTSFNSFNSPGDCHTEIICEDLMNDCGEVFGGCFSACLPWPTFTPPPCVIHQSSCAWNTKVCTSGDSQGITTRWGGCIDLDDPESTLTEPSCPDGWATASTWTDISGAVFPPNPSAFISDTLFTPIPPGPTNNEHTGFITLSFRVTSAVGPPVRTESLPTEVVPTLLP